VGVAPADVPRSKYLGDNAADATGWGVFNGTMKVIHEDASEISDKKCIKFNLKNQ
jgi:hypothetical protein